MATAGRIGPGPAFQPAPAHHRRGDADLVAQGGGQVVDQRIGIGIARMGLWTLWDVPCTYPLLERMKLEVAATGGVVRDAEYGADITLKAAFPAGTAEKFQARLTGPAG